MHQLGDESVELVVTSPPYPMIEMWDGMFIEQDSEVGELLEAAGKAAEPAAGEDGSTGTDKAAVCYRRMHEILDRVWTECARVLVPGGFACINIGDATRKLGSDFRLFTNHSRVTAAMEHLGFQSLPPLLWRKPTNAPNKFMGSGMLPAGAYVTLEHEYVLIFRKGGRRRFSASDAARRRRSAFFWEERNSWFSDIWDFRGIRQAVPGSAAPVPQANGELWSGGVTGAAGTAPSGPE